MTLSIKLESFLLYITRNANTYAKSNRNRPSITNSYVVVMEGKEAVA